MWREFRPLRQAVGATAVVVGLIPFALPVEGHQTPGSADRTIQRCAPGMCEIELIKRATLRDPHGRLPTSAVLLARDRVGQFYVAAGSKDHVLRFDAAGRMSAAIGSAAAISAARDSEAKVIADIGMVWQVLAGADGTILIGDGLAQSIVVLSHDLRLLPPVKSVYMPRMILHDGTFLVVRQIRTADRVGLPMHVVDRAGRVVRSFGADPPAYRADQRLLTERVAGSGRDETIWSAAPGRYVFERWDPSTGRRLENVPVDSPWFIESASIPGVGERPNSIVVALWEQDSVLWVLSRTADAEWTKPENPNVERPHDPIEYDRTFDWVLEAIDPGAARVIAHRRFGSAVWTAAPHFVITSVEQSDNVPGLIVSSVGLKPKEK